MGVGLAGGEGVEQLGNVRVLEVVRALLDLVLVVDVAVGDRRAVGTVGQDDVEQVVDVLQVHAQPFQAVGALAQHRPAIQDRKSVGQGKSVTVRVDLGGGGLIKKKRKA